MYVFLFFFITYYVVTTVFAVFDVLILQFVPAKTYLHDRFEMKIFVYDCMRSVLDFHLLPYVVFGLSESTCTTMSPKVSAILINEWVYFCNIMWCNYKKDNVYKMYCFVTCYLIDCQSK